MINIVGVDTPHTITGANHPRTSRRAARRILVRTGTIRRRVLMELALEPGTDEELAQRVMVGGNTERPRRIELVHAGYVTDSGQRRTGPNGCVAIVWVATDAGRRALMDS